MSLILPYPLPATGYPQAPYVQADFDTIVNAINNGTGLVTSITGTANQVIASSSTGAVTLSLPQSIAAASTPTFASETLTAVSNQIVLGTTRTVTLTAPTPATNSRVVTFPDLSGDYSVVGTIGAQTIAGAKTFSSAIAITATSNHIVLSTSSNTLTINANTQATSARTWNVPDVSGNGTFAALEGTQTFSGTKTFSAQIISSATSNHLKLATASNNAIISVASIATADRTITIPDPGGNANFVLSEGTATINGVKTFGNDTIHSADVYTTTFTDYSSTSTITGWTTFTTKKIFYKKVGKLMFVTFEIGGTSNSTSTSFTLPNNCNTSAGIQIINYARDNSGTAVAGTSFMDPNTATLVCIPTVGGSTTGWTNSNTKSVIGQFFYQTT